MAKYYDWEIMISPDTEITFEIGEHGYGKEFALMRFAKRSVGTVEKLQAENVKLRKLCSDIWRCARLLQANKHIDGMRISDEFREECERAFEELGIEVD